MAEAFLIVSGEYSDFGVNYVCDSEEVANQYVEALNKSDGWHGYYSIMSYNMVSEFIPPVPQYKITGTIVEGMMRHETEMITTMVFPGLQVIEDEIKINSKVSIHYGLHANYHPKSYQNQAIIIVTGYDEKTVNKVYSEQRAQMLANFDVLWEANAGEGHKRTKKELEKVRRREAEQAKKSKDG